MKYLKQYFSPLFDEGGQRMRKLRVVELYAGTGRSTEPFRRWKKAEIALLVDANHHACQTYRHNFPKTPYAIADLADMKPQQLESLAGGKIDILIGCPPCQGFSESGKREQNDPRNDHVLYFCRLAAAVRPSVIAMENVPMAGVSEHFLEGRGILSRAGYRITTGVLNSALYGSTQTRFRLVMIAVRDELRLPPALPNPTHLPLGEYFDFLKNEIRNFTKLDDQLIGKTAGLNRVFSILRPNYVGKLGTTPVPTFSQVTEDLPMISTEKASKLGHIRWAHQPSTLAAMEKVPEGGRRQTDKTYFGASYGRLHRQGLVRTITTFFPNAGSGRFWHPTENRAITLREAARIQGFPDSFHFLGGATEANAVLVGNALDAALSNATFNAIQRLLD
jgi:DNA (cytosine-5)-methyltransferase 1